MDVFGVGNAIVDTLAFVEEDFIREHDLQKGIMTLVDSDKQARILHALSHHNLELRSGGSAANTMIGIARSGGTGFYTGKVSRDTNGEFYRQDLLDSGIHFDVHPSPDDYPTGSCVVLTTPDAERTMYTHLGVSTHLTAGDIDSDRIKQCRYSYVEGYLWGGESTKEATLETMSQSRKHETPVAFSFSDPGLVGAVKEDFFNLVREYVDVVFCNADEARNFSGMEELQESARHLSNIVDLAFITNGAKGALVVTKEGVLEVPGFEVKAVDTNGAGDAFAAGVLYGLTHGYDAEKSARWGNYMASRIVQVHGARLEGSVEKHVEEILGRP